MDAKANPPGKKRGPAPVWAGELIVQNGRKSGARRPLQVPLTIVGKDPGCDIRLNSSGIDSLHCLLVHGPTGLIIRDLDSANGTFVNGERAGSVTSQGRRSAVDRRVSISSQPAAAQLRHFRPGGRG